MPWTLILKGALESVLHADHFEYKTMLRVQRKKFFFSNFDPPSHKFQAMCAHLYQDQKKNVYQSHQGPQNTLRGLGHLFPSLTPPFP